MNAQMLAHGTTVAAARRALTSAFRAARLESPELDARLLVGHALGSNPAATTADQRILSGAEAHEIAALAARRLAHEPVARIRGHKEFWSLDLRVTRDVLVPRPETETVVEAALAELGQRRQNELRIADLGTGSGALLIALLRELPRAIGVGTDRSIAALKVARENAAACGVAGRACFVACDYGAALGTGHDLVVTNPPYVRSQELGQLPDEVRKHDPTLALDGGHDGLDGYRVIAAHARRVLARNGTIVAECGFAQDEEIAMLFVNAGLSVPQPARPDLSGIPRAIVATQRT